MKRASVAVIAAGICATACGGAKGPNTGPVVRQDKPWTNKNNNVMIDKPATDIKVVEKPGYFEVQEPWHGPGNPDNFVLSITKMDKVLTVDEGVANLKAKLESEGWTQADLRDDDFLGLSGKRLWMKRSQPFEMRQWGTVATLGPCMVVFLETAKGDDSTAQTYLAETDLRVQLDPALGSTLTAQGCE